MVNILRVWRNDKVDMVLRGCVLASEISRKSGYAPDRFGRRYKDNYFVFDSTGYIPKINLTTQKEKDAAALCFNLDDYLPLVYFSRNVLNLSPHTVRERIRFMEKTGKKLFEYKRIGRQYYIHIPKELQRKFDAGFTYTVTDWKQFRDFEDVQDMYIFADWCILFLR